MRDIYKIIKNNNVTKLRCRLILGDVTETYYNLILFSNKKLINIFMVNIHEISQLFNKLNIKFDIDKIINNEDIYI